MDFSKKGWQDGLLKAVKVVLWVGLSGAIVAIAEYVRGISVPSDNYLLAAEIGLLNALLAGASKWVTTKQ